MKNIKTITGVSLVYIAGIASILGSGSNAPSVRTFTFWGKEGYTYEQSKTHHAQCKYDVGIQKFETRIERDELIKACMEKDGFRMVRYSE